MAKAIREFIGKGAAMKKSEKDTERQLKSLLEAMEAVRRGDLSIRLEKETENVLGELAESYNGMLDILNPFANEVTRVAREVGTEGKLGGQAEVAGVAGTWKDLTDNVNAMASSLTSQVRDIAKVTTSVAKGDLEQKITVDAQGEILELKNTINIMVDQLGSFASEVTRVAREVGLEGKLGAQADVPGVTGTWKELTDNDNVNMLAANLTNQVRNIALVGTAIANGDLTQKITVEASGEIAELKEILNAMVDNLNIFGSEVTRVAREVGVEGQHFSFDMFGAILTQIITEFTQNAEEALVIELEFLFRPATLKGYLLLLLNPDELRLIWGGGWILTIDDWRLKIEEWILIRV